MCVCECYLYVHLCVSAYLCVHKIMYFFSKDIPSNEAKQMQFSISYTIVLH